MRRSMTKDTNSVKTTSENRENNAHASKLLGRWVRYHTPGGWFHAILREINGNIAVVEHPVKGRKRVLLSDIELSPFENN